MTRCIDKETCCNACTYEQRSQKQEEEAKLTGTAGLLLPECTNSSIFSAYRCCDPRGRAIDGKCIQSLPELLNCRETVFTTHSHSPRNGIRHRLRNRWYQVIDWLKRINACASHLSHAMEGIRGNKTCEQGVDSRAQPIDIGTCIGSSRILFRGSIAR